MFNFLTWSFGGEVIDFSGNFSSHMRCMLACIWHACLKGNCHVHSIWCLGWWCFPELQLSRVASWQYLHFVLAILFDVRALNIDAQSNTPSGWSMDFDRNWRLRYTLFKNFCRFSCFFDFQKVKKKKKKRSSKAEFFVKEVTHHRTD